jgi:hypothetical protein
VCWQRVLATAAGAVADAEQQGFAKLTLFDSLFDVILRPVQQVLLSTLLMCLAVISSICLAFISSKCLL